MESTEARRKRVKPKVLKESRACGPPGPSNGPNAGRTGDRVDHEAQGSRRAAPAHL